MIDVAFLSSLLFYVIKYIVDIFYNKAKIFLSCDVKKFTLCNSNKIYILARNILKQREITFLSKTLNFSSIFT